ncbi:HamA C-terminal domain-containing protein [Prevotella koreensis]
MRPPFFNIIIHKDDTFPDLHGVCAGFESRQWRKDQLVDYLFEYLPEFALTYSELENLTGENMVAKMRQVVKSIYQSEKFKNRGEFGELLLHAIIRETYNTIPAISKIYYKDSPNDTVKGFDAVHVVVTDETLELWLGEAKFYDNIYNAISDVIKELNQHIEVKYVKDEFVAITNKIDVNWPHADRLKTLLHPHTSLDDVFSNTCIPVLLTYDSNTLAKYNYKCVEYIQEITEEFRRIHIDFCKKLGDFPLTIHLFLFPLNTKVELINSLESKLKIWQSL